MRKASVISILIVVAAYPAVWGNDEGLFSSRGLYGSLEYGYMHQSASDTLSRSTLDEMTQNYLLGTRGAIYSPNLLSYQLEGAFTLTDTKSETNGAPMDSSSRANDYRINTDLIRATNYPFSLYMEKNTRPYSSVMADSSFSFDEASEKTGIRGSVKLPYFTLNYMAETSQMDREESFADELRDNQDYMVSIYKDYEHSRYTAAYNERFQDYFRDDRRYGTNQGWSDHTRDGKANWSWDVDKDLRVESSLGYMESSYIDMTNLSGSFSVDWRPEKTYHAGVSIMTNMMEAGGSRNDAYTLNAYSYYQVTPEFSTTQNLSLYSLGGDYTDQTMEMASVAGNYLKTFDGGSTFNTSLTFMGKAEQNDVAEDLNVTLPDRNTYGYNLNIGGSTPFDAINARLSGNLMYDDTRSTLDESTQRFSAYTVLSSTILYNLMHNLSASYMLEKSGYYTQNRIIARDAEVRTIDNTLRYWQNVGYGGKLSFGGGVTYTVSQMEDESVARVFPHAEGSFSYRFWNGLDLSSNLSASQDSVSDLTNYSAYVGLNYVIRRIILSLSGRYLLQTGGTVQEYTQSSVLFKIKRTF